MSHAHTRMAAMQLLKSVRKILQRHQWVNGIPNENKSKSFTESGKLAAISFPLAAVSLPVMGCPPVFTHAIFPSDQTACPSLSWLLHAPSSYSLGTLSLFGAFFLF